MYTHIHTEGGREGGRERERIIVVTKLPIYTHTYTPTNKEKERKL
jgi:hypothetical protein